MSYVFLVFLSLIIVFIPVLFQEARDRLLQAKARRWLREENLWKMGFIPPLKDFNLRAVATFKVADWEAVEVYNFSTSTWHCPGWRCLRVVSVINNKIVFAHPVLVRVSGKTYLLSKQGGFRMAPR